MYSHTVDQWEGGESPKTGADIDKNSASRLAEWLRWQSTCLARPCSNHSTTKRRKEFSF
jgi:hypothetical protein